MTTKTDLSALSLTGAELTACHGKAVNAPMILAVAKEQAVELSNLIGEILKVLPAGTNKTTLTSIQSALQ